MIGPTISTSGPTENYADDLAALTEHLDLKNATHVGHSTGGGEVVRYLVRHGESRAAKAVLIAAVPPLMVKTAANPGGLPKEVFDGFQAQVASNRAQFYYDVPAGPRRNSSNKSRCLRKTRSSGMRPSGPRRSSAIAFSRRRRFEFMMVSDAFLEPTRLTSPPGTRWILSIRG
jgi:pimeloyl-ACP methyl ester carboxylesterase